MPTSEILDHVPPHSVDDERAYLGCIFLKAEVLDDVSGALQTEDFYCEHHQRLHRVMVAMHDQGVKIDALTLRDHLKQSGDFDAVGGAAYLAEIAYAVPVWDHYAMYADAVRRHAQKRRLRDVGLALVQGAYQDTADVNDMVNTAEIGLSNISTGAQTPELATAAEAAADVIDRVDRIRQRSQKAGVMTSVIDFDQMVGGLFPGELTILAARTGVGKSALACQIAYHAGSRGKTIYFASMEMSRVELAQRIVCSISGVSSAKIRRNKIDQADADALRRGADLLGQAAIVFDDRAGMTTNDVARAARRVQRQRGLDLVIVDYLTRLRPIDRRPQRHEQVGQMTDALKELARSLDVPVLCLAQLNRESEKQDRPSLIHLRESGSIEQDADVVIFVHRKVSSYRDGGNEDREAELIVAKNRNGECGAIKLLWDPARTQFSCEPKAEAWDPNYMSQP